MRYQSTFSDYEDHHGSRIGDGGITAIVRGIGWIQVERAEKKYCYMVQG